MSVPASTARPRTALGRVGLSKPEKENAAMFLSRKPFEALAKSRSLLLATAGFGAYISAIPYSSFYGAIAGAVLLLIYLHVSTIAFLLGVVVDSLLRDTVRSRKGKRSRPASKPRSGARPRRNAA